MPVNEVPEKYFVRVASAGEDELTSSNTATCKEDCAWSNRVEIYGPNFSAPFPITVRHKYFHNYVAERSPDTVETTPDYVPY